ncbi:hypothetical protein GCM10017655_36230 [Pseudomonas turukhanskensis]|uniref:DUF5329 domain-containing protein n=2 Tax=Pseudomonas turukhanskensis TaxID=1806536 RepID=A0A9W6KAM4_9PSED|nr:hypothetical protein GCM10017655_36230 [Pseudomonas turukhanskensis]
MVVFTPMWRIICISCCLLAATESQAALNPQSQDEVGKLLAFVENSGCSFIRNGSAYDGKEARMHLQQKLDYLENKGLVSSSEDFIQRAATGSSISGKPYSVDCKGQQQPSADWLNGELQRIRKP